MKTGTLVRDDKTMPAFPVSLLLQRQLLHPVHYSAHIHIAMTRCVSARSIWSALWHESLQNNLNPGLIEQFTQADKIVCSESLAGTAAIEHV